MAAEPPFVLRYSRDETNWEETLLPPGEYLIGRNPDCDFHFDNPEVSRYHANLRVEPDSLWLTDLGSTNGTLVDEVPLPPNRKSPLQPGQEIYVGPYTLIVESTAPEVSEPPQPTATVVRSSVARPFMYDLAALREAEFAQIARRVYLNNARNVPLPKRVRDRVVWSLDELLVQPSQHMGPAAFEMYANWLTTLAKFVNASSSAELVVVPGLAAGINTVAQSLSLRPGDNIVFCDVEFPSNVYPWKSLERDGVDTRMVPAVDGGLTLDALAGAADERTRVAAVSSVQFFTGHRTDLVSLGAFCRERGILFVVDAMQSIGHEVIDVQAMNIDVLVTGGHKSLMAPPGVGFMYVREAVSESLAPRLFSSLSTRNFDHYLDYDMTPGEGAMRFLLGTPHVAGMHGILESVALINELTREAIDRHTSGLISYAIERARSSGYDTITPLGQHGPIMSFKSEYSVGETKTLVDSLEAEHNITVASFPDRQGVAHLRVSVHCYNTRDEIDRLFEALKEAG